MHLCFFVKSLCLHFCEVTKLRINEYHEYATLLFFWSHKIYIVVNLRNCDLYERCECSYLLFSKIKIFNFCNLSKLLFSWWLRVSAFAIFVNSWILLFVNFRHHYLSEKLEFVHFLILWSHEFCIVVNFGNGCSYECCDFLHVLFSWNHDNCIFNEFAKSPCFTFCWNSPLQHSIIVIELICGDTNSLFT